MKLITIIASVAVLCGFGIFLFLRKKNILDVFSLSKCKEVECLSMSDVIKFFKDSDRLSKLRENKNFVAVAMKEKQSDGSFKVVCCIYDKEKEVVVDIENASCYHTKNIDKDLQEAFGDKSMIVLS